MKLRCQLSILMGRDKMNIQDVCRATGLSRNTVADLYYEKSVRINYNTILLLCKLFNCEVGELFVIEKDAKEDNINDTPTDEIDEEIPL
jgi:putative transcriptional regulator